MKNLPRLNIRRRRYFLLRLTILLLCICLFLQIKYNIFSTIPGKISVIPDASCTNISFNNPVLNCSGEPLQKWCQNEKRFCNGCFIIYNNLFVLTRSAIIQPKLATGKRIGGEDLKEVLNQPEKDEYFQFERDFIQLPCAVPSIEVELPSGHLPSIFTSINGWKSHDTAERITEPTIAVRRQDYVNIYHTITDLYTVYLLCRFFQYDPKSVRVLFLDAHPNGSLDLLWTKMFHSYTRLGHLKNISSIEYRELIWSQPQPKSEIDIQQTRTEAPSFFFDFREHILKQFAIDYQTNSKINCQSLQIFFLVRHNYVAHPRNPTGKVSRQLPNEQQILDELKKRFAQYPHINFTTNHFENLSFAEQLKIIINTDVFVGMHGAGLTHVLFLKNNRALIELVPRTLSGNHFSLIASMNKIKYYPCRLPGFSRITTDLIYDCIANKVFELCPVTAAIASTTSTIETSSTSIEILSNRTVTS